MFTGKLGENINECLASNEEACANKRLNKELNLLYLHNLFNGEAN